MLKHIKNWLKKRVWPQAAGNARLVEIIAQHQVQLCDTNPALALLFRNISLAHSGHPSALSAADLAQRIRSDDVGWRADFAMDISNVIMDGRNLRCTTHGQANALETIIDERQYQDAQHGVVHEHGHTIDEWRLFIGEYIDDIGRRLDNGDDDAALNQMRKVTALALACMEQHGWQWRKYEPDSSDRHQTYDELVNGALLGEKFVAPAPALADVDDEFPF